MKSLSLGLIHLTLLMVFSGCGKNNESGKKNQWGYQNPYGSPYVSNINSPYFSGNGGLSVNQVMQENPCVSGFMGGYTGYPGMPQPQMGQRLPVQIPLTQFPTVISPGEVYVGVTSYGDVAVVAGQAPGQPPLFVAYLCPRSFSPNGQGQLLGVKIGAYSNCLFKPITAATMVFPGGATADFRYMDGGSSLQRRFSFCR
jgi:hypothetical protein